MLKVISSLGEKTMTIQSNLDKKYSLKAEDNFKNMKIKSINSLEGMKIKVKENI